MPTETVHPPTRHDTAHPRGGDRWDSIAPGVAGLRTLMVNVFTIEDSYGGWVLVDAGLPFAAAKICSWAERRYGAGARPQAILLTHGHFDHVGALRTLVEHWNVPVYAHRLELPYLTGRSSYPPPDPVVGRGLMALMSPLYPRGPIRLGSRVQSLPEDGSVPGLADWRWIHTPGHTPGHVSFWRESDRTLIAGDAVITTRQESLFAVAIQKEELHGPPAYYTSNWAAAERSVCRIAELRPNVLATGHGLPMSGPGVASALERLAERFHSTEIPARGRYVQEPAIQDENGVLGLPPKAPNPYARALAVAALAGGAWWIYSRRRRHSSLS